MGYSATKIRYFFRMGVKACVQCRVCPCGVIMRYILPLSLWFSPTDDNFSSIPRTSIIVIIIPLATGWYDGVIWRHSSQELSPICCCQYSQNSHRVKKENGARLASYPQQLVPTSIPHRPHITYTLH